MSDDRSTVVVITAKDAAGTAACAVTSALCQRAVAEVVFVDDGSRDGTAEVAAAADDQSGRLKIIRQEKNVGPARARNIAIAASSSPLICILDADDYLAPSRLDRLFAVGGDDWDLLADDLFFHARLPRQCRARQAASRDDDAAAFARSRCLSGWKYPSKRPASPRIGISEARYAPLVLAEVRSSL